ncbi:MAG TPA: hypothetical protein VN719_02840, partial [Gemmatimonadales bacterium]|nr:hypothetical protein [Gemmatimonadales bacterium]
MRSFDRYIYVHQDRQGTVWQLEAGRAPESTTLQPMFYAADARRAVYRALGSARNAPLLTALYVAGHPIEVMTPVLGATRAEREEAPLMLVRMRDTSGLPTSRGGWHPYTR